MKILRLYVCLFFVLLSTEIFAQSDITMKYNWMFTDVAISNLKARLNRLNYCKKTLRYVIFITFVHTKTLNNKNISL